MEVFRPLLIAGLVVTEVGIWQWRMVIAHRGSRVSAMVLGIIGAVLQITAITQVVAGVTPNKGGQFFEHGGKNWIFYEDYSYQKKRASICCAEVSSDGSLSSPVVCLESPDRHYSYPHVFRTGNDVYMVPESYDSERVDLFRCEEFPDRWTHAHTLFQGRFVDTTIWQHDGLWWMMTTRAEPDPRAG